MSPRSAKSLSHRVLCNTEPGSLRGAPEKGCEHVILRSGRDDHDRRDGHKSQPAHPVSQRKQIGSSSMRRRSARTIARPIQYRRIGRPAERLRMTIETMDAVRGNVQRKDRHCVHARGRRQRADHREIRLLVASIRQIWKRRVQPRREFRIPFKERQRKEDEHREGQYPFGRSCRDSGYPANNPQSVETRQRNDVQHKLSLEVERVRRRGRKISRKNRGEQDREEEGPETEGDRQKRDREDQSLSDRRRSCG